ncbi:MAG: hypothetical protein ACI4D6_10365 [Chordicoccus sp.]
MADYSMFKQQFKGFDRDEVLSYIHQKEEEMAAKEESLKQEISKRDKIISELKTRIILKDDQVEQLRAEIDTKYKKYIDTYSQISDLAYEAKMRGEQLVNDATVKANKMRTDAENEARAKVDTASAQAEKTMSDADAKAQTTVKDADAKAKQTVEEADSRAKLTLDDANRKAQKKLDDADAEAKRRVASVESVIDAKLTDGRKRYSAVHDEMNDIVRMFNQIQRKFMQSYKEVHEIINSMPEAFDDAELSDEDELDDENDDELQAISSGFSLDDLDEEADELDLDDDSDDENSTNTKRGDADDDDKPSPDNDSKTIDITSIGAAN